MRILCNLPHLLMIGGCSVVVVTNILRFDGPELDSMLTVLAEKPTHICVELTSPPLTTPLLLWPTVSQGESTVSPGEGAVRTLAPQHVSFLPSLRCPKLYERISQVVLCHMHDAPL